MWFVGLAEYPLKALTLLSANMSSDFSSAVQKLSKRILKKSKIVIFFLLLLTAEFIGQRRIIRYLRYTDTLDGGSVAPFS